MSWFQQVGRVPRREPRRVVVVISGPIRAGKTTLAERLAPKLGAERVRTKDILLDEYGAHPEIRLRRRLQRLGEKLDVETDGCWVAAAVRRRIAHIARRTPIVVDAVRIPQQVEHLKEIAGARIIHVHLNARLKTLRARYAETAAGDESELATYDDVRENPTEARINQMRDFTRLRFNTSFIGPRALMLSVLSVARVLNAVEIAVQLAVALVLGTAGALLSGLMAWFWFDHLDDLIASILSTGTFVFFAVLIGSALTHFSPIERDVPPRPGSPAPAVPPERVAQPSGPEVEKSRTLTRSLSLQWPGWSLLVCAALLSGISTLLGDDAQHGQPLSD